MRWYSAILLTRIRRRLREVLGKRTVLFLFSLLGPLALLHLLVARAHGVLELLVLPRDLLALLEQFVHLAAQLVRAVFLAPFTRALDGVLVLIEIGGELLVVRLQVSGALLELRAPVVALALLVLAAVAAAARAPLLPVVLHAAELGVRSA